MKMTKEIEFVVFNEGKNLYRSSFTGKGANIKEVRMDAKRQAFQAMKSKGIRPETFSIKSKILHRK
jgi:hypothetical protein